MVVSYRCWVCAVVLSAAFDSSCSGLEAHGSACRFDDDCKGDRVCGPDGVCADPATCAEGAALEDAGSCRDTQAPTCPNGDLGCYASQFNNACPGAGWELKGYWSCEGLGSTSYLNFFAAGFTGVKEPLSAVALGPEIELRGREAIELWIHHRFNRAEGPSLTASVKLVAEGIDPTVDGIELLRPRGTSHESVETHLTLDVAGLTSKPPDRARIVFLVSAEPGLNSAWSWEVLSLKVQAK